MKKIFLCLFSLVLFFSVATSVSAETPIKVKSENEDITIVEVEDVQGIPNASVDFIDLAKVKEGPRVVGTGEIGTLGVISEKYTHSTYTYSHDSISAYEVGPRTNDRFLLSVATGQTSNLQHEVQISGTVTFEASVSGTLKSVINLGLVGTASGTVGYTYTTSQGYTGPSLPYTNRDYYGAIQYDRYSAFVNKRDHYDIYNGTIKTGTTSYSGGTVTTNGVKKPKKITYSKDFTQK